MPEMHFPVHVLVFIIAVLEYCLQQTDGFQPMSFQLEGCDLNIQWNSEKTATPCTVKNYYVSVRPGTDSWVPMNSTVYHYGNIGRHRTFTVSVATRYKETNCRDTTTMATYLVQDTHIRSMTEQTAEEGDTAHIACDVQGPYENLDVKWIFDRKNEALKQTIVTSELLIPNIKTDDAGNYTCLLEYRECGTGRVLQLSGTTRLVVTERTTSRPHWTTEGGYISNLTDRGNISRQTEPRKEGITLGHMYPYIVTGGGCLVVLLALVGILVKVRRGNKRKRISLPPSAAELNVYEKDLLSRTEVHIYSEIT